MPSVASPPVVRVKRAGGDWTTLGTEEARGVTPEGLTLSADTQGPSSCSFTLRRDPVFPWGDLAAGNQVQVEVAGVVVWGGRVAKTPGSGRGAGQQIAVSCEGWRAHLDDDQGSLFWVSSDLSRFQDTRTLPGVNLGAMTAAGKVQNDRGVITLGWDAGSWVTLGVGAAVTFDAGPGRQWLGSYFDVMFTSPDANVQVYVIGNDSTWWNNPGRVDVVSGVGTNNWPANTGVAIGGNLGANPRRYCTFMLYYVGPAGQWATGGPDKIARISGVRMIRALRDINFSSPYPSNLLASNVVQDAISTGLTPLLSSDTSLITTTSFVVPEYAPDGYRTPRELIEGINAFHDYLYGVTADRRAFFKPRPTVPAFEVGSYSGGAFDDSSLGDLSAIYNRVIVQYTEPAGTPQSEVRTNANTLLTAQGFTRSMRLPVSATLTQAGAQQIGDVWLARHANAPMSGSITVAPGDVRDMSGQVVHPSVLLTRTGERLRISDRVDPVTGAVGRVGTIVNVTYDPAAETAAVQLDNDTASFETFLNRLAAIQGR